MKTREAIDKAVNDSPWSKRRIAGKMGITAQQLNDRLHRNSSPKVNVIASLLAVAGYKLVIVPEGSHLPDGSIVIDPDED